MAPLDFPLVVATCIDTLPMNALLTSSVDIKLISDKMNFKVSMAWSVPSSSVNASEAKLTAYAYI